MPQYLLSVYQPDGDPPPPEELEPVMQEVFAWREELKQAGAWVFDARLYPPSTATVLQPKDDQVMVTDGPYLEGKEHLGGFTVFEAEDLDAALAWAKKLTLTQYLPIEIRPMTSLDAGFEEGA